MCSMNLNICLTILINNKHVCNLSEIDYYLNNYYFLSTVYHTYMKFACNNLKLNFKCS
jgi:hypothetical protein